MHFRFDNQNNLKLSDLSKVNGTNVDDPESKIKVENLRININGINVKLENGDSVLDDAKQNKDYFLNDKELSILKKLIDKYNDDLFFLGYNTFNIAAVKNNITFHLGKCFICNISYDRQREGLVINEKFYISGFDIKEEKVQKNINQESIIKKEDSTSSNISEYGVIGYWYEFVSKKEYQENVDELKEVAKIKRNKESRKENLENNEDKVNKQYKITAPNNSEELLETVQPEIRSFQEEIMILDESSIDNNQQIKEQDNTNNCEEDIIDNFEAPIYESKKDNIITIESYFCIEGGALKHIINDVSLQIYDKKISNLFKQKKSNLCCMGLSESPKFKL